MQTKPAENDKLGVFAIVTQPVDQTDSWQTASAEQVFMFRSDMVDQIESNRKCMIKPAVTIIQDIKSLNLVIN